MPASPLWSSFARTLVSRSADKKISGIAVLFQPDVNARTKSAGRKGVATSDNPRREVIYPGKIWLYERKKRDGGKEKKRGHNQRYIRRTISAGRANGRVYIDETANIGNPED